MKEGMVIMGKQTRAAKVEKFDDYTFTIILSEGMNRQIRRMCYKYGYEVISLQRTRIMNLELGQLKEGELRSLTTNEVNALRQELF
jgi:23S rRNA pseudouridine2604 synthase